MICQELLGVLRGIPVCKKIGGLELEVSTDSLRLVEITLDKENCPCHCANILAEIMIFF